MDGMHVVFGICVVEKVRAYRTERLINSNINTLTIRKSTLLKSVRAMANMCECAFIVRDAHKSIKLHERVRLSALFK